MVIIYNNYCNTSLILSEYEVKYNFFDTNKITGTIPKCNSKICHIVPTNHFNNAFSMIIIHYFKTLTASSNT